MAIFVPAILTFVINFIKPSKFDWSKLKQAKLVKKEDDEADPQTTTSVSTEISANEKKELETGKISEYTRTVDSNEDGNSKDQTNIDINTELSEEEEELKIINYWIKIAYGFTIFVIFIAITSVERLDMEKGFFPGWVTVAIFWIYMTFIAVVLYPLWDGLDSVAKVIKGIYGSLVRQ